MRTDQFTGLSSGVEKRDGRMNNSMTQYASNELILRENALIRSEDFEVFCTFALVQNSTSSAQVN